MRESGWTPIYALITLDTNLTKCIASREVSTDIITKSSYSMSAFGIIPATMTVPECRNYEPLWVKNDQNLRSGMFLLTAVVGSLLP
jgi:hypothetical protein